MATMTFDTLQFVETLKDGEFSETQAKALSAALKRVVESNLDELATKRDLAKAKLELIKWMVGAAGGVIAAIKLIP